MLSKTIKLGLIALLATAFLAGCASTSDTTDQQPAPAPTTQPAQPTPAPAPTPEPVAPALETVFYFEFDKSELLPETRAFGPARSR